MESWENDDDKVNIKFPRDPKTRSYPCRFSLDCMNRNKKLVDNDDELEVKMQFLDTVAENRRNFATLECERVKAARTLCHNVGAPGTERFKGMLRTNWTQDCPVMENDIDMEMEIWGPDAAHLKGKTTRKKPRKVC